MFQSRREVYEQSVMDSNEEPKKAERKLLEQEDVINDFLKQFIKDEEKIKDYNMLIQKYDSYWLELQEFWNKQYYKQGMIDFYKLMKEIGALSNSKIINKVNKFYDYADDELLAYIYTDKEFKGEKMKNLRAKYRKIGEEYPNVLRIYEDNDPIVLSKEEMEQLIKLHDVDIAMGSLELKIAFKKGMEEIINH